MTAISYNPRAIKELARYFTGARYRDLQKESYKTQIGYDEYIRNANIRALNNWNNTYGRKGLKIQYPEFSYSGQIERANTAIARNYIDSNIADTNYYSNLPYRIGGLFALGGRISRYL